MKRILRSKRVIALSLLLSAITISITLISVYLEYKDTIEVKKSILEDQANNEKIFIQNLYRNGIDKDSILKIIKKQNLSIKSLGTSGEFAIAEIDGDSINFIFRKTSKGDELEMKIYSKSGKATAMTEAIKGKQGSKIGRDYKGIDMIAGYTYIDELQWGVVAKVYLNEIIEPYQQRMIVILIIAIILTFLCAILFIRLTNPLISEIEKNENYLKTTVQSIGDGFITTDRDGNIVNMNPIAEYMCGYKLEEAKGKYLTEIFKIINAETRNPVENPVEKVINTGLIVGLANHTILVSKSGKEYQIADSAAPIKNSDGEIMGVVLIFSDVTEKYLIQDKIIKNENYLKETQKIARLGTYNLDIKTGNWESSEILDEIFGIDDTYEKSITGWVNVIHPDWQQIMNDYFTNEVIGNKTNFDKEYKIIRHIDKEERWLHGLGKLVFNEKGEPIFMIGTIRDITEKVNYENAIKDNEERFRMLFEKAPLGYQSLDFNGNFIEVNQQWLEILGFEKEEVIGKWFGDFLTPNYQDGFRKRFPLFKERGKIHSEFEMLDKNGNTHFIAFDGKVGLDIDGKFKQTHCILQDITETKQLNEAIREHKQLIQNLIDNTSSLIYLLDLEGRFILVNKKLELLFGVEHDKIIGQTRESFLPKEIALEHRNNDLDVIRLKHAINFDEKNQEPDGVHYYSTNKFPLFDANGNVYAVGGISTDITDRINAEINLLKAKKDWQAIFNGLSHPTIILDSHNNILEINDALRNKIGSDFNDIKHFKCWNIFHSKESNCMAENCPFHKLTQSNSTATSEMEMEAFGGHYLVACTPIMNDKGALEKVIHIATDITERKNSEMLLIEQNRLLETQHIEYMKLNEVLTNTNIDLEIAKAKAEESDKLKTAFLQNMSHEIRTPLNGILGFSKLLQDENLKKNEISEFTFIIQQSGNRLLEIVNNVLDISKIETGQLKVNNKLFPINSIFSDLLTFFTPLANSKNIELHYHNLDDTKRQIYSDEAKLNQIFTNLINNAIKFTSSGRIDYGYEIKNNEIQFYVKDTGIGIPKDYFNTIFDRFTQVDLKISRGYEGAGLGLAICKGLVELLGGHIWLDSVVGQGTTFYFTIPITKESMNNSINNNVNTTNEENINLGHGKILIAEDDWTSFYYLRKILENTKITILHAENGKQAVDYVENNTDIKLILMDIKMPIMNGMDATKLIKKIRPDIPIIAQTAYAFNTEKEEILLAGCSDYLSKPISKDKLLKLIEKYS